MCVRLLGVSSISGFRLKTRKRLVNLGPTASTCSLCQSCEESGPHLLLSCPVSYDVWCSYAGWLGLPTTFPEEPSAHLLHFIWPGYNNSLRGGLLVIWLLVVWSLWLMRNKVIFNNGELAKEHVLDLVQVRSWQWLKSKIVGFHLFEWKGMPLDCIRSL